MQYTGHGRDKVRNKRWMLSLPNIVVGRGGRGFTTGAWGTHVQPRVSREGWHGCICGNPQAEIVPSAPEQVKTCVGNVLSLYPFSPPIPMNSPQAMNWFIDLSDSNGVFDPFLIPRDRNHRWCPGLHHLCSLLGPPIDDLSRPCAYHQEKDTRGFYLDHVGQ